MIIEVEGLKYGEKIESKFELEIQLEDMKSESKVEGRYLIKKNSSEITIELDYELEVLVQCVHCLEDFIKKISGKINNRYLKTDLMKDQDYNEEESEMIIPDYDLIKDDKLDLAEIIREDIILNMDSYEKCSDDCKGLDEYESYKDDGIDSRWDQLLNLYNN